VVGTELPVATTRPVISLTGTGPQDRESSEAVRLSPMTHIWPGFSVTEKRVCDGGPSGSM